MRYLDNMNPTWAQQDHWHNNPTLTQRHVADQGIAFFQLTVKEGDDGLLSLKLIRPIKTKLKYPLNAFLESEFAFFIKKRSFIDNFHEIFCSSRRPRRRGRRREHKFCS